MKSTKDMFEPRIKIINDNVRYFSGDRYTDANYYNDKTLQEEWGVNRKIKSLESNFNSEIESDPVQYIAKEIANDIILKERCIELNHLPSKLSDYIGNIEADRIYRLNYGIDGLLDWIKELDIYIIQNDYRSTTAVPYMENDGTFTSYNPDRIEKASVILINPYKISHFDLIRKLIHELRHLYDLFHTGKKYKKYIKGNDIELSRIINQGVQYNLSYIDIDTIPQRVKRWSYDIFRSYLAEFMYWLNKEESEAHLENIFNEMYTYFYSDEFAYNYRQIPVDKNIKSYLLDKSSGTLYVYRVIRSVLNELLDGKKFDELDKFWEIYEKDIEKSYNMKFASALNYISFLKKRCDKVISNGHKFFMKFWETYL